MACMQLPNDAEIIMATLNMKRHAQTAVPPPPSTYAQDVATITSHTGAPTLSAFFLVFRHCGDTINISFDEESRFLKAEIANFLSEHCGVAISCIVSRLSPCCDAGKFLLSVSHIAANSCDAAKPLRSKTKLDGATAALVCLLLFLPLVAIPINQMESKQSCSHVMWQVTQAAVGPVEVSGVAS